jgi:hypothetical protein
MHMHRSISSLPLRHIAAALAATLAACSASRSSEVSTTPPVTLSLDAVSAEWLGDTDLLVTCSATLTNDSGATLGVRTNFASAFDGLSIVLTGEDGAELARQAYIYHQSPYAEDQTIDLPPGRKTKDLGFPLFNYQGPTGAVEVRLEGGLPGTAYETGLASGRLRLEVPPRAAASPAVDQDAEDAAVENAADGTTTLDAGDGEAGAALMWPADVPAFADVRQVKEERTARGDRLVEFDAGGELDAAWTAWLEAAKALGWKVVAEHGGTRVWWRSASLRHTDGGRRAWLVLRNWGDMGLHGNWSEPPAPGEREAFEPTGECVAIPHPRFEIIEHVRISDPTEDRSRELPTYLGTIWWFDLDGDGAVDAAVPQAESAYCPDDVRWTLYVARRDCGYLLGTVQGTIDGPTLVRANTGPNRLPIVTTKMERIGAWPGPGGIDANEVVDTTRTWAFDGVQYIGATTEEQRVKRTCSPGPCPMITCTGAINFRENGSAFEILALPETLGGDAMERWQEAVRPAVERCAGERHGNAVIGVTIEGATGKVTKAEVEGPFRGVFARCMRRAVTALALDRFAEPTMDVTFTFVIGE